MKTPKFMFLDIEKLLRPTDTLNTDEKILFKNSVYSEIVDIDEKDSFNSLFEKYAPHLNFFNTLKGIRLKLILENGEKKERKLEGNERDIIHNFFGIINKIGDYRLIGYNILSDKIPFITQKALVHKLPIPKLLQLTNKKPWENEIIDVAQIWKGYQYSRMDSYELFLANFESVHAADDFEKFIDVVLNNLLKNNRDLLC